MTGSAPEWLLAIVALIGGGASFYQYLRNSRAASAIRAADEMEKFYADEAVTAALHMIDWQGSYVVLKTDADKGKLVRIGLQAFLLATRAHGLLRKDVKGYSEKDDAFALKRLRRGQSATNEFSLEERRIREIFDRFFNRLERMESLIRRGVIRDNDFRDHFSYWLNTMDEVHPKPESSRRVHLTKEKRQALWNYIRAYEFNGVVRLFARYGKTANSRHDRSSGLSNDLWIARHPLVRSRVPDDKLRSPQRSVSDHSENSRRGSPDIAGHD